MQGAVCLRDSLRTQEAEQAVWRCTELRGRWHKWREVAGWWQPHKKNCTAGAAAPDRTWGLSRMSWRPGFSSDISISSCSPSVRFIASMNCRTHT